MAAEVQSTISLDLGAWQGDRAQLATARRSSFGDIDDLPPALCFQVYVSRTVQAREGAAQLQQLRNDVPGSLNQRSRF